MAEGGNKNVTHIVEGTEHLCDVCLEDNSVEPAPWYCKQCKQFLCDPCQKYHRKLSVSKSHELIQAEDVRAGAKASHEETSDEVRAPTCHIHAQPFQLFCPDHNVPVCASCKVMDHRKCTNLQDLELAGKKNEGVYEEVLQHLRSVHAGMDNIRDGMGKEKDRRESQKKNVIAKIEEKMREVNDIGTKQISEVEAMFKKDDTSLDRESRIVEESQHLIQKKIQELELVSNAGSPEERFLAAKATGTDVKKYYEILSESSQLKRTEIDFVFDSNVAEILSLGKVSETTSMTYADLHHRLVKVITIDEPDTIVAWIGVLPHKQLVLMSGKMGSNKTSLQLYSSSKQLQSKLDIFNGAPVLLNDHEIIVSNSEKTGFQLINIDQGKLKLVKYIDRGIDYTLATKFSTDSILAVEKQHVPPTVECQILKHNGELQKQISLPGKKITNPVFVRVNKNSTAIYMVDSTSGCFGFSLKGECLFHFDGYDGYMGLSVDEDGKIYITGGKEAGTCHIVQLSPTGDVLKHVLHVSTLAFPIACIENKLYISAIENVQQEKESAAIYQMYI